MSKTIIRTNNDKESVRKNSFDERHFLGSLGDVYAAVTQCSEEMTEAQVRALCDQEMIRAFDQVDYRIVGEHHFPDRPGNVVILNHHRVNPYYTLANGFQITLDTHFVSARLCFTRHQQSAIRVVREGRSSEQAHTRYFSRLGHIPVKTIESDHTEQSRREAGQRRKNFFRQCRAVLASGTDLILCPEGTSYGTEDSPGEFKPGAFIVAGQSPVDSLLVPIAIANFDKRLDSCSLGVVVKRPFRLSDRVDVNDRKQLREFLRDYREEYKTYVEEAREIAAD